MLVEVVLLIVGAIFLFVGILCHLAALRHKSEEGMRVRYSFKPLWKMRPYYDKIGFRFAVSGSLAIVVGVLAGIAARLSR